MINNDEERGGIQGASLPFEPLLRVKQVAVLLGITNTKRVYELGIPVVYVGTHRFRWRPADVRTWIDANTKTR